MRRDSIFWGGALILLGVLFFLQAEGIIGNVFQYFWPLALILLGSWIILGVYWKPADSAEESFSVPLGAAQRVNYRFAHGAARVAAVHRPGRLVGTSASG
jgi:hypothetical protein